jgi:hypothetical protein
VLILKGFSMNISIKHLVLSLALTSSLYGETPKEPLIPHQMVNDHLASYSETEKQDIARDQGAIEELCFKNATQDSNKNYLATAGGPGACKSTILENYIAENSLKHYVYGDPDQRALVFMINTYHQSRSLGAISKTTNFQGLLKECYTKWRGGSNYIASSILNKAFDGNFSIAHGTTSTGKGVKNLYKTLKDNNYKITLLLCGSTIENQRASIEHRLKNQALIQSSTEDLESKYGNFFDMLPTYVEWADTLHLYWTQDFVQGSTKIATYARKDGLIKHHDDFAKFEAAYEKHRAAKNPSLPPLSNLLTRSSSK